MTTKNNDDLVALATRLRDIGVVRARLGDFEIEFPAYAMPLSMPLSAPAAADPKMEKIGHDVTTDEYNESLLYASNDE